MYSLISLILEKMRKLFTVTMAGNAFRLGFLVYTKDVTCEETGKPITFAVSPSFGEWVFRNGEEVGRFSCY